MKRKSYAAILLCTIMGIFLSACQSGTVQASPAQSETTAEGGTIEEDKEVESNNAANSSVRNNSSTGNKKEDSTKDAVSGASQIFYEAASFDRSQLWEAIAQAQGGCTIATVNEDGTPNIIIAVPAAAGESHLFFNWADNETKENVMRTGKAMVSYYVYNPLASDKNERNRGARLKLSLEQDSMVLEQLEQENEGCTSVSTVFRIEELLPLG